MRCPQGSVAAVVVADAMEAVMLAEAVMLGEVVLSAVVVDATVAVGNFAATIRGVLA